jgi:hypothetical protein
MAFSYTDQNLRRPTNLQEEGMVVSGQGATFNAAFEDSYASMTNAIKTLAGLPFGTLKGVDYWYAGQVDKELGNDPVSKEEFDQINNDLQLGLPWEEGMGPTQLNLLADKKIGQNLRRERINPQYQAEAFVGGLLPEAANIVNLIPFGRVATLGRGINKTGAYVAQGKKFGAALQSFKQYGKEAFIGNAAVEPLYYISERQLGNDYSIEDSALNVIFGTGLGVGFFGTIGSAMAYKRAGRNALKANMHESLTRFMETGRTQEAAAYAYQQDPQFKKYVSKYTDLSKKIKTQIKETGVVDFNAFDEVELKSLDFALDKYRESAFEAALTKSMSESLIEELEGEGEVSIKDLSIAYKRAYANISMAYKTKDFKGLTDFERKILETVDYDYDIDGFDEPISPDAPEKQPKTYFTASAQIIEIAKTINKIKAESGSKTLNEAVGKGAISRTEANILQSTFNDTWGKTYAKEIEISNRIINDIFGYNFKLEKSVFSRGRAAFVKGKYADVINLNRAEYITAMQSVGIGPFSLLFHEATHTMQHLDPVSWNMVQGLIKSHPKLEKALRDFIEGRSVLYSDADRVTREIPSVIMEWAVTQEEFWKALKIEDKSFYEKFKELVVQLLIKTKELYKNSKLAKVLNDKTIKDLLDDGSPEKLARSLAEILVANRNSQDFNAEAKNVADTIERNVRLATSFEQPLTRPKAYQNPILEQDFINVFGNVRGSDVLVDQLDALLRNQEEFDIEAAALKEKIFDYVEDFNEYETNIRESFNNADFLPETTIRELYNLSQEYNNASSNKVVNKLVADYAAGSFNTALDLDLTRRIYSQLRSQDVNSKQRPEDVVRGILDNEYTRKMYRALFDLKVEKDLTAKLTGLKVDEKIALLRTLLDGQQREGTGTPETLELRMIAAAQADANVIFEVLDDYGLYTLFYGDVDTEWMKAYRGTPEQKAQADLFGNTVKEANKKFHEQLMDALRNNELPDSWKDFEGLTVLFETIQKLGNYQINKLNSVGAFTNKRKDYPGVSPRYESDIVASMTKNEFVVDMSNRVDFAETSRLHGGVLKVKDGVIPFNNKTFLENWYDEITSTDLPDSVDMRIDEGKSRLVVIKPELEAETILKYSGKENIGKLMISQIQRRAETVELAKFGGSKPKELWDRVSSFKKLTKKQKVEAQFLKWTVDYLFGDLEAPANHNLSKYGKRARQLSNITVLSGAGLSALTDVVMAAATLKVQGVSLGALNLDFIASYTKAIKRRFKGDETGMAEFLRSNGAGWDVINNTASQRLTSLGTDGRISLWDRANSFFFKINGINAITSAGQEAYVDLYTRDLAEQITRWNDGGEIDDFTRRNLADAGITEQDYSILYQSIYQTPDGVNRIAPSTIVDNPKLVEKLRFNMTKYIRQAIITPDAGTRAQGTFGFRAGTPKGETARVATQYQPFQLAMSKLLYRRYKNGYFGENGSSVHKMSHLMGYVGASLAMAYFVSVIKDILKGKEPINLFNMTPFQFKRIVDQTGIPGIFQVPSDVMTYGLTEAVAPLPGTVLELTGEALTLDGQGAADSFTDLVGGNTLGLGLIGEIFGETLNEIQTSELDYISKY